MSRRRSAVLATIIVLILAGVSVALIHDDTRNALLSRLRGDRTVGDVLAAYGPAARERLAPAFEAASVPYPPERILFAGIKDEELLEVWAAGPGQELRWIATYPVLAASGQAGPKLREGDRQVPEGIYRIIGLNPNSAFHLSMKLDYPNEFDLEQAHREGRENLGGDIFIHGRDVSIGCLAMGDPVIEELFVLAADVGIENATVVIAPSDPRVAPLSADIEGAPDWLPVLYEMITEAFEPLAVDEEL
ncbi:MAG: L,D-transpeptidase family protein [Actinobacteria bacterium]|nr:L,D-transpeptidase family protein [Actinomycetota bacterium]MCL5887055.1 L,D-transpeptidase family protein [Actinomycetota bacterium]